MVSRPGRPLPDPNLGGAREREDEGKARVAPSRDPLAVTAQSARDGLESRERPV